MANGEASGGRRRSPLGPEKNKSTAIDNEAECRVQLCERETKLQRIATDPKNREPSVPFEVKFVPASRLADGWLGPQPLLAVIQYEIRDSHPLSVQCPSVVIPTLQLNEEKLVEVWTSPTSVVTGQRGELRYAANGQALFGTCELQEREGTPLEVLTQEIYRRIFQLVEEEGYPNILRLWNYLSDINAGEGDLERYRRFCVGRYEAFAERNPGFEGMLPAGSGVGIHTPGIIVRFVASREAGKPVQNPRQVNAYHYPAQYGPRSPSFSRAMFKDWGAQRQLFLSGTASIVEHQTSHVGDVRAQLAETLRNMRALLRHAAEVTATDFQEKSTRALFKVYIRHPEDFSSIERLVRRELEKDTPVLYLNADLCRHDLLVEIEGMYQL
jgi:chorismate lyase / 3-hydroxybenzoate synthase